MAVLETHRFLVLSSNNLGKTRGVSSAGKPSATLNFTDLCVVNEANSDVQIRSADGFTFHLHRAVLEMNTGAFPGPDVPTDGEPATLTENANVLAILFSFIYPKRHPDLQNENFYVVSAVAEAAVLRASIANKQ